ncbi:MAG: DUF3592 domain-containing protein [Pseudomonadota bacterium]
MLRMIESLADTLGRGPVLALGLIMALATAALPLLTWRLRGTWEPVEAEVIGVASRRTIASSTHAVAVRYADAAGQAREATVQIDVTRTPISPGDTVSLLRGPSGRVVRDRWDGASVPLMLAPLIVMGTLALFAR